MISRVEQVLLPVASFKAVETETNVFSLTRFRGEQILMKARRVEEIWAGENLLTFLTIFDQFVDQPSQLVFLDLSLAYIETMMLL